MRHHVQKLLVIAAMAATIPVYAAQAQYATPLSSSDPKFDTRQCQAARQRAEDYAKKTGDSRFLTQFAWFAAIGSLAPSGTYEPTPAQKAINRDVERRCITVAHRRK